MATTASKGDKDVWLRVMRSRLLRKEELLKSEEPHWHTMLKDRETSDEDEDGCRRPKLGEGICGRGPPLTVTQNATKRGFHDGAGLCSPGRWTPEMRTIDTLHMVKALKIQLLEILKNFDFKRVVALLACGKVKSCPFPE